MTNRYSYTTECTDGLKALENVQVPKAVLDCNYACEGLNEVMSGWSIDDGKYLVNGSGMYHAFDMKALERIRDEEGFSGLAAWDFHTGDVRIESELVDLVVEGVSSYVCWVRDFRRAMGSKVWAYVDPNDEWSKKRVAKALSDHGWVKRDQVLRDGNGAPFWCDANRLSDYVACLASGW